MLAIISQVEGLRKSSENYTGIKYECLWSVFVDVLFFFFFFPLYEQRERRETPAQPSGLSREESNTPEYVKVASQLGRRSC